MYFHLPSFTIIYHVIYKKRAEERAEK